MSQQREKEDNIFKTYFSKRQNDFAVSKIHDKLDRLFILLESGSSSITRRAAAKQIGEVQKLYPHELHNLLNRLVGYLHNTSWETRIAAAQAVEAVLNNVPQWQPNPCQIKKEEDNVCSANNEAHLSFETFDLSQVLQRGARLMGSEGTEFDFAEDNDSNSSDHLVRQRELINDKLGFSQASKLGINININDLIALEDMKNENRTNVLNNEMIPVEDILGFKSPASNCQNLSCREMNRARRKARQSNVTSTSLPHSANLSRSNSLANGSSEEPERKKAKIDPMNKTEMFYNINQPVPDATGAWGDAINWPLEQFSARLFMDLFNAKWEVRHGAATALRELINTHSSGAGKCSFATETEMNESHYRWIEDAALRLLCVLSLDRFGDFVSDQVVAPVRETCAQVLGTLLKQMTPNKVSETVKILIQLIKQNEWEVRHGGLLGLKYMFVVREDLLQTFLPMTINDILMGLFDNVDDVGAVAASTLIPVASWLPKLLSEVQVSKIVKMLWDLLLDQDELTSACNSFMGLLAAILCLPNASQWIQMESMSILVPRLWPFLSHSTSSVRRSTLHTLKTLTASTNVVSSTPRLQAPAQINRNSLSPSFLVANMNFDSKTLGLNFGVKEWTSPLLQEALRHIYQRILIEPVEDIQELCKEVWTNLIRNAELSALLHAACPYVASWLCLAMQPARLAFDPAILVLAKQNQSKERRPRPTDDLGGSSSLQQKLFLGGNEGTPIDVREKNVMKARVNAAKMLGLLSHYLVQPAPGVVYSPAIESPMDCYTKVLLGYLNSRSSLQRLICGMVIAFWALSDAGVRPGPPLLQEKLKLCVMEYVYYDEVAVSFTRLLQDAHDFIATLKQYKVPISEFDNCKILTLDQIQLLCTTMTENLRNIYGLKTKTIDLLEERRRGLNNSFRQTSNEQNSHNVSTQSALAGAIVCLRCLPEKLNPVIKPLMESIKREECELMQQLSAEYLVHLLDLVVNRNPCPNNKIVTNLCTLLKSDTDFTPSIVFTEKSLMECDPDDSSPNPFYGIVTLSNQQKCSEQNNSSLPRGPGRPPASEVSVEETNDSDDPSRKQNRTQRIGANHAIIAICKYFQAQLREKVPTLWNIIFSNIEKVLQLAPTPLDLTDIPLSKELTNDLITSLQLIEIAAPHIHQDLHDDLFELLPQLGVLLTYPLKAVRHMVSRCLAALSALDDCRVMKFVVEYIIPLLQTIESVIKRQGAAEAIDRIVDKMQLKMIPYVVLLVVPLLGRMSDPDEAIRLVSTHCFATLIQLMPLDGGNANNPIASRELQERRTKDRQFLEYLFAPKSIPDFKVPVDINAELRSYQQAGVNWLWFLNKYNLHGILCDDMGLGKTLQTICILAGDHYQRRIENLTALPSIVICPPTLTGHWVYEVSKFLPSRFLRPLHYVGLPIGREKLRPKVGAYNLVVASYDTVRKDIDFFSTINWNYCVLDEGHFIKNGKTKSSKAIKMLKANHRLILSGTPIQNNVLELWSLFDFLMPGFLGTEKQFMNRYSRPILASRDPKSSPKEQENGVLAMEALHRQILPFLLRRVKEDVLTDLPPKITQDLLCELSPLQERLYEDFSKTHLNSEIKDCLENMDEATINKKTHIFQALRYLQNVCNHPKLVLSPNHPEYAKTQHELVSCKKTLDDIEHSAKLPALKQLLLDCGIGVEDVPINQHRALIFCQLKAMLDIVENDLLRKHLPAVSYLRLDGSVPASERHEIVTKFNADPSIDVLLLTTQVGGLGLNLTGADTVIFVEHDWNPMKDLQAMDRAHRIGQKKVVNVYRLITRKSLEEKIMGLQKFKILTANTIVSAENASMETMGTDQLLDLFNLTEDSHSNGKRASGACVNQTASILATTSTNANSNNSNVSMKQVIESLPDLWEEKQYEEEYDLTQFIQGLK